MPRRKFKERKHKSKHRKKQKNNDKSQREHHKNETNDKSQPQHVQSTKISDQSINQLKQDLHRHFKINSDLSERDKDVEFHQLLMKRFGWYLFNNKNKLILHEIDSKITTFRKQFGQGAFVCFFNKTTDVYNMKFDASRHKTLMHSVGDKYQIIGDGNFVWFPLKILNVFCTPNEKVALARQNYLSDQCYYVVTMIFGNSSEYIAYDLIISNNKLENYLLQNNGKKYSVRRFIRQFPDLPDTNNLLSSLNEARSKLSLLSSKSLPIQEYVVVVRDSIIPKPAILEYLRQKNVSSSRKSMITGYFIYIYGPEMKEILIEKCKNILNSMQESEQINNMPLSYETKEYVETRYCACIFSTIMVQLRNIEELKEIEHDFVVTNLFSMRPELIKMMEWIEFQQKLVGRKCANCNIRENRSNSQIQTFRKCKNCQSRYYCSVSCQKLDWNKTHRNECNDILMFSLLFQ